MRTSFLCGILCLCFGINWGQSSGKFQHAEVILQNGETRTGLIVTNFQNSKVLRFKTSESAAESAIELPQIKEVRIGDTERLVPYCPTDASAAGCQWLVTLLDGKVGLYRNINDANLYYLQEEGAFYVIKLNTLSGIVTALQSKCAAFKQLNGKYRFTSSSLLQMVNDYSQCKYPGQTQVNVPKTYHEKTAQLYLGIQLGFNQGSTAIRENLFADRYFKGGGFRDQVGITFGMPVELQIGKHLAIQSGLHFLHRSTLRDSVNIRFTFEEYFNQIKFSLTYLDIPFMLQYRFGSEKLEPFVQVGAQVGMPLARKFSHTAYDSNLDYETPQHKFQAMNIGFRAGLGVNKSLGDKLKLQLLGQYIRYSTFFEHTMPAFLEGNQIESSIFQVSGGLLWRVSK